MHHTTPLSLTMRKGSESSRTRSSQVTAPRKGGKMSKDHALRVILRGIHGEERERQKLHYLSNPDLLWSKVVGALNMFKKKRKGKG